MIRIIIADDHPAVRKGVRALLEAEEEIEVVGEAQDGREAILLARRQKPDVVIMDMSMPNVGGLEATRSILAMDATICVVVLSMYGTQELVDQAFASGVSGYVMKQSAVLELVRAVHAAVEGECFLSSELTPKVQHERLSGS